jgi:hypothetical protein
MAQEMNDFALAKTSGILPQATFNLTGKSDIITRFEIK